jgi:hypothetical protein
MQRSLATILAAALAVAAIVVFQLPDEPPPFIPRDSGLSGPEVAQRYCQGCHRLPVPGQLPKETWPFVINWMGNYLGFEKLYEPFGRITDDTRIPPNPLVSTAEMSRLGRYFMAGAPLARDFRIDREPNPPLDGYVARVLDGVEPGKLVTLLHIDEQRGLLWVGLAGDRVLSAFDRAGKARVRIELSSDPIHYEPRPEGFRLTTAGDFDDDRRRAQVIDFRWVRDESSPSAGLALQQRMLVNGFHRSAESHSADIDGDGHEDLLIVGFGDGFGPGNGKVSVLWASADFEARFEAAPKQIAGPFLEGAFEEQVLHDRAGGLGARIVDLDGDGRLDVLLLATQGTNELVAFLGREGRRFERVVLIAEHVSYGFNHFEVADFDGDGHLDLVVVNGNNMELPDPPLRPYHGVRIWLGDGKLGFREAYFYPMYGALTALVGDFDADGDLDIAVNAFYPDWDAADPETFTLLENRGKLDFEPRSLGGASWGRWLRVAAGDIDGDGRIDLVLGAANIPGGGLRPERPKIYQRYRERLEGGTSLLVLAPR